MPVASCVDDDGQRPAFEVTWPTLSEVADRQCNDYKPRTGETSYRCVIREGWVVLLQPTGDGRPTRGDRDSYSLCGVVPPQHHHAELMVREVTRVEPAGRLLMSGPVDGAATVDALRARVACISSLELTNVGAGTDNYVLRMRPKSGPSAFLRMAQPNHFNIYFLTMWLFRDVKIRLTLPDEHKHATSPLRNEAEKFLLLTNVELLCAEESSLHQVDTEPLYFETDPDDARAARCVCGKEGLMKTFPVIELTTQVVFLVGEECKELVRMAPREHTPQRRRLFNAVRRDERAARASESALHREEVRIAAVVLPFVPRGQGLAGRVAHAGLRRMFQQYSACKSILIGVYNGHLLLGATAESIEAQLQTMYAYTGDDEATAQRHRAWIERGLEVFFKCERAILQTLGRPVRGAHAGPLVSTAIFRGHWEWEDDLSECDDVRTSVLVRKGDVADHLDALLEDGLDALIDASLLPRLRRVGDETDAVVRAGEALCGRARSDGWWRALGDGSEAALTIMDDVHASTTDFLRWRPWIDALVCSHETLAADASVRALLHLYDDDCVACARELNEFSYCDAAIPARMLRKWSRTMIAFAERRAFFWDVVAKEALASQASDAPPPPTPPPPPPPPGSYDDDDGGEPSTGRRRRRRRSTEALKRARPSAAVG